jgi:hypothetical protein
MSPDAVTPFHLAVPEAELDELRARLHATRWPEREARLVALVAEEDHVPVDIAAEGRIRVTGHGVETPLEDVSRYEVRVGDDAVALALSLGPDVDQQGSGGDRVARRSRVEPLQPTASRGEQLVDRRPCTAFVHDAMNVSASGMGVEVRGVVSARGGSRGRSGEPQVRRSV